MSKEIRLVYVVKGADTEHLIITFRKLFVGHMVFEI